MNSPVDPIFWLHHANVDRLWVAWVAAGGGRRMPAKTSGYWSGSHVFNNTLSMARRSTFDTRTNLQYMYANETMPNSLPLAQASGNRFARIQASADDRLASLPPTGSFKLSGPAVSGSTRFSLGGALNIGLDRRSVSAQLPVNAEHWAALQEIARGNTASIKGSASKYKSASLVLDEVELDSAGANGGYFYQVYLNVPSESSGFNRPQSLLLGTLGPFQIRGASHHGHGHAQLRYPIGRLLRSSSSLRLGMVSVSFVRIDGDRSPDGPVIGIGEARLELSTESAEP
jgi:tyrosinase